MSSLSLSLSQKKGNTRSKQAKFDVNMAFTVSHSSAEDMFLFSIFI